MIYRTIVQPIQVIIISSIYYSSCVVICSFSYNICIVDCWPVFSYWSDQRSFILETVHGCVIKLSVGHNQTRNTDFLPPQVWGRSWRGWCLGVQTCLIQFFFLIQNLLQVFCSSLILLIFDLFVSYLLDHRSLIMENFLRCVRNFSVGLIQTRHMDLLPPHVCRRSWWGC